MERRSPVHGRLGRHTSQHIVSSVRHRRGRQCGSGVALARERRLVGHDVAARGVTHVNHFGALDDRSNVSPGVGVLDRRCYGVKLPLVRPLNATVLATPPAANDVGGGVLHPVPHVGRDASIPIACDERRRDADKMPR